MTTAASVSIGELERQGAITELQDGNHGALHPKAEDYVVDGVPFVMSRNISDGVLHLDTCEHLTQSQAESLRVGFAKTGDVLLTHKGTIGLTARVPLVDPYVVLTPQVTYYRTNSALLDPEYLKYAFQHRDILLQMQAIGNQSTRPFVSITAQRSLNIWVWPPAIQRKIAAILSAYDDLIKNNNRRIKLLEETAQRIYREWFIDFRYPGHEDVPLVDSELGRIPKGWRAGKLGDLADINVNTIRKITDEEEIRYIDIASVTRGRVDQPKRMLMGQAPGRARRRVADGDIIWSTVRPNLRAHALLLSPGSDCVASTGFAVLSSRRASFAYVYAMTTTDEFVGYLVGRATGSAYPAVTPSVFQDAPVVIPPADLLRTYADSGEPLMRLASNLGFQVATLRATRDLLLPRLFSGEIDVTDLDIAVSEVAA